MVAKGSLFQSAIIACLMMATCVGSVLASSEPLIIDMVLGEPIEFDAMLDDMAEVRLVFIGEIHTIARHHELQARVIRGLSERGKKLALGMEVFSRAQQPALDRWLAGAEPFSALMDDLGKDRWTNIKDYEPLLSAARELGAPVLGINAADDLVRKIARQGLEGLSVDERKALPDGLERINPLYDRLLRLKLRVHKAFHGKALDNIIVAQVARDETMAQAVAAAMESQAGKDRLMLVIAGAGHVNYGFGIPEGVYRRAGRVPARVLTASDSGELVLSEEDKHRSVPVDITHEDLSFIGARIADYLQVIPLRSEPGLVADN